jgi:hypothetical protein
VGVIEIILALFGLGFLVLLAVGALVRETPEQPVVEDPAAPYREGLHAAVRMQRVAQDLEQQIYAEAARLETEHSGSQARGEA